MTQTALVANAHRMMTSALALEDGVALTFADGARGVVPYTAVPEISGQDAVRGLALPNPYEMIVEVAGSDAVEIPWDFARHYCDASYRPAIEAIAQQGWQTLGARVRALREGVGMTQDGLARAAGIGRVTLVRVERGGQAPRFQTLAAIADALGRPVPELLLPFEPLSRP